MPENVGLVLASQKIETKKLLYSVWLENQTGQPIKKDSQKGCNRYHSRHVITITNKYFRNVLAVSRRNGFEFFWFSD